MPNTIKNRAHWRVHAERHSSLVWLFAIGSPPHLAMTHQAFVN